LLILVAPISSAQALPEKASKAGVMIGAALNVHRLSEANYASTLSRKFNLLELEDEMNWGSLHPDEKTIDLEDADRIAAFARMHDMQIPGHNLVWGTHNPEWLTWGSAHRKNFLPGGECRSMALVSPCTFTILRQI
jgi:endo-1,4-beta-xylanase